MIVDRQTQGHTHRQTGTLITILRSPVGGVITITENICVAISTFIWSDRVLKYRPTISKVSHWRLFNTAKPENSSNSLFLD